MFQRTCTVPVVVLLAAASAQDFLTRYPNAPEKPEVRFYLATSLKELGRNNDSLREVLKLLQEQREQTKGRPEVWAYWQQRAGNLIANQLYREGDYTKALEVYLGLTQLDPSPAASSLPFHRFAALMSNSISSPNHGQPSRVRSCALGLCMTSWPSASSPGAPPRAGPSARRARRTPARQGWWCWRESSPACSWRPSSLSGWRRRSAATSWRGSGASPRSRRSADASRSGRTP